MSDEPGNPHGAGGFLGRDQERVEGFNEFLNNRGQELELLDWANMRNAERLLPEPVAAALGPAGVGLSAVSAAANGAMLADDISGLGWRDAYHSQAAYNHAGGAVLGAAHTILPFVPGGNAISLGMTAGEVATDGVGRLAGEAFGPGARFTTDSVAGGLVRGMFGDRSLGDDLRRRAGGSAANSAAGNVWDAVQQTGYNLNPNIMAYNLANTVGRGVYDEGAAIVNAVANGEGAVGGALRDGGRWVGRQASAAGGAVADGATAVGDATMRGARAVGNGAAAVGGAIADGAVAVGDATMRGARAVGNGAVAVGDATVRGARAVGTGMRDSVNAVMSW